MNLGGHSQARFTFLDGMRGVAAMFVVLRHSVDFWQFQIHRSYLAVDLFFILSGFVISHSYERKILDGTISVFTFLKIRFIRIYPIYALSLIFSAFALIVPEIIRQGEYSSLAHTYALSFLFSIFLLPHKLDGQWSAFTVNVVYWSLFFEVVVNILYAYFAKRLSNYYLIRAAAISIFLTVIIVLFKGKLDIGFMSDFWSLNAGFWRALMGITIGILLFRYRDQAAMFVPQTWSPWIGLIVIIGIFLIPSFWFANPAIDLIAVIFVFPLCVTLGSQNWETPWHSVLDKLGVASYPVYLFHAPLSLFLGAIFGPRVAVVAPFGGVVLLILLIWFALLLDQKFDRPIRKYLIENYILKHS